MREWRIEIRNNLKFFSIASKAIWKKYSKIIPAQYRECWNSNSADGNTFPTKDGRSIKNVSTFEDGCFERNFHCSASDGSTNGRCFYVILDLYFPSTHDALDAIIIF